ncbi:MAG: ComEC/Rec2 family competence protein [Patescibacteria group bacterium]|nr:ComEC/Rec2 family competence protein [Patescibacteria group bacterium]
MTRSKTFLFSCLFFILGIFIGSYYSVSVWILFLATGFFISLAFLFGKNKKARVLFFFLAFLALGFIRIESGKLSELEISEIDKLNNKSISISGTISEMPETKNGKQKIIIKNIKMECRSSLPRDCDKAKNKKDGGKINGKMIVYANRYPEYNLGDIIKVEGKIKIPEDFEGFKYRDYLLAKNIYYIIYYPKAELKERNKAGFYTQISRFRKQSNDLIKKIFPQPQAGIVSAMTLAIKSDISEETLEAFNKTGTRHIIAISGMHLAIVALALMYFLLASGLNRNYAFYFALLGIVFFVILVGFPPSAVRAAIMAGLALFAIRVGRLKNAGNAIVFAAVLMLVHNSNLLRYDIGFQLSFAAILGIVYIFPKLDNFFKKYSDFLGIKTIFLITVSAQVATLPIIINSFGNFSLLSVLANILILPLVPIVMLGGFLLVMIGFVNLAVAQILAYPIWLILFYQIETIKFFAGLPFGLISFNKIGFLVIGIYYLVLICWLNFGSVKKRFCRKTGI